MLEAKLETGCFAKPPSHTPIGHHLSPLTCLLPAFVQVSDTLSDYLVRWSGGRVGTWSGLSSKARCSQQCDVFLSIAIQSSWSHLGSWLEATRLLSEWVQYVSCLMMSCVVGVGWRMWGWFVRLRRTPDHCVALGAGVLEL